MSYVIYIADYTTTWCEICIAWHAANCVHKDQCMNVQSKVLTRWRYADHLYHYKWWVSLNHILNLFLVNYIVIFQIFHVTLGVHVKNAVLMSTNKPGIGPVFLELQYFVKHLSKFLPFCTHTFIASCWLCSSILSQDMILPHEVDRIRSSHLIHISITWRWRQEFLNLIRVNIKHKGQWQMFRTPSGSFF